MVGRDEDVRHGREAIELTGAATRAVLGLELGEDLQRDLLGFADDDGIDEPGERQRIRERERPAREDERVSLVAIDASRGDAGSP
jgi:hypothetical protein